MYICSFCLVFVCLFVSLLWEFQDGSLFMSYDIQLLLTVRQLHIMLVHNWSLVFREKTFVVVLFSGSQLKSKYL